MSGWIKLHRKIYENPRSKDPEWIAIWLYLLSHAAHKPTDVIFKGQRYTLQPGQLLITQRSLSESVGVSQSKVSRVLNCLESESQMNQQKTSANTLISITNWTKYQDTESQSESQMNHKRIADESLVNRSRITEQEYNNIENLRREEYNNYLGGSENPPAIDEISRTGFDLEKKRLQEQVESLTAKLEEKEKKVPRKKEKTAHPLFSPLKEEYCKANPEYYWTAKDGENLNQLIRKVTDTVRQKAGRDPTAEEVEQAARYLFSHLPEWMKLKNMTTIPDINSQYNKIISELKNGKRTNKIQQSDFAAAAARHFPGAVQQ